MKRKRKNWSFIEIIELKYIVQHNSDVNQKAHPIRCVRLKKEVMLPSWVGVGSGKLN